MKIRKLTIALLIILALTTTVWARTSVQFDDIGLFTGPAGSYSRYDDLDDLVTTLGPGGVSVTVIVNQQMDMGAALVTVTANITLDFKRQGAINVAAGQTLAFAAGPKQFIASKEQTVFVGTGAVTFVEPGTFSAKNWGARGDDTVDDIVPLQAVIAAMPTNSTLDLLGGTYRLTAAALVINKRIILKNGSLHQTTNVNDVVQIPGPIGYAPSFYDISLVHDFNAITSGSLLVLGGTGAVGFFEWKGSNGINYGGRYGVRGRGGLWQTNFERLWFHQTYSSAFYMPAQGDVVTIVALGGSTTLTLTHIHVTEVQTADADYAIGTGYDTVILKNVSADHVSVFGYFKASPLQIVNCSAEGVRNPVIGAIAGPHRFIQLYSGYGQEVRGFHVTFAVGFVAPAPGAGNVNSFVYAVSNDNLNLQGIRGALPALAPGYSMLDLEGGEAIINSTMLGNGVRLTANANYIGPNEAAASGEAPFTIDRLTDDGVILQLQRDGINRAYLSSDPTYITLGHDVDTSSIRLSTTTAGSINRSVQLSPQALGWFPVDDNILSNGLAGNRWTEIFAVAPAINVSDAREKQQIMDLTEAEKNVAVRIKGLIKKFKINSEVEKKGNNASFHVGVIAQAVAQAFESEGLDPVQYAMFNSSTWRAYKGKSVEVNSDNQYIEEILDVNGKVINTIKHDTVSVTRLGIRYSELLIFIISAM